MKTFKMKWVQGFTLVEMMLVMTIISALIYMSIGYVQQRTLALSIDRASAQMQQILNAGLSYYVNNGSWPTSINTLTTGSYLPSTGVVSPWGANAYAVSNNGALFTVTLTLPQISNQSAIANVLVGKLPLASTTGTTSTCPPSPPAPPGCVPTTTLTISASVNIPGQNLNNATAVNMTGIYHNGACVPVPSCPVGPNGVQMTPTIMVAPASVSGMSDPGTTNVYPISSFTAYATPQAAWDPAGVSGPAACSSSNNTNQMCISQVTGPGAVTQLPKGNYWRVCLQVSTEKNSVTWDNTTGQYATVIAITRCSINNENSGSSLSVWQ